MTSDISKSYYASFLKVELWISIFEYLIRGSFKGESMVYDFLLEKVVLELTDSLFDSSISFCSSGFF